LTRFPSFEPKNYSTWREKLAILVAVATEGTYTEIWNLPTGAAFRFSGRPHPDGAIATFSISGELYHQTKHIRIYGVAYQLTQKIDRQSKTPASHGNRALNLLVCGERYVILLIKSTNATVGGRT